MVGGGLSGNCPVVKQREARLAPRKRAQRLTFWVLRPPGWMGGLLCEGAVVEKCVHFSKVCFPWVSKGGNLGCPGIFTRMSQTCGGVQKGLRKVCAHFSALGLRPVRTQREVKITHLLKSLNLSRGQVN